MSAASLMRSISKLALKTKRKIVAIADETNPLEIVSYVCIKWHRFLSSNGWLKVLFLTKANRYMYVRDNTTRPCELKSFGTISTRFIRNS